LHLEQICLRSYAQNKFGYNVVTARITTPDLYCSASRKPIIWTQNAPMHRRTVKILIIIGIVHMIQYEKIAFIMLQLPEIWSVDSQENY